MNAYVVYEMTSPQSVVLLFEGFAEEELWDMRSSCRRPPRLRFQNPLHLTTKSG